MFKFTQKITDKNENDGTKDVEIIVSLTCFSKFWKTLEMPLINCEINLILTWSNKCELSDEATTFAITDIKLYVLVVTLSTQDNVKLLKQSKVGFSRTTNWNKFNQKYLKKDQTNI